MAQKGESEENLKSEVSAENGELVGAAERINDQSTAETNKPNVRGRGGESHTHVSSHSVSRGFKKTYLSNIEISISHEL